MTLFKATKEKLLTLGYIEYKIYSDTSFIYLMKSSDKGRDYDECLCSYEFDDNVKEAMRELYNLVVEKGLLND